MGIVKKFKDWFRKDNSERELLSLKEIKEEVMNILSYAFDNSNIDIDIYTYYEGEQLTIEIKCPGKICRYIDIKDDFESFIEYFKLKYSIYDDSFVSGIYGNPNIDYYLYNTRYSSINYDNIQLELLNNINDENFYFRYIDIYIPKYKKES